MSDLTAKEAHEITMDYWNPERNEIYHGRDLSAILAKIALFSNMGYHDITVSADRSSNPNHLQLDRFLHTTVGKPSKNYKVLVDRANLTIKALQKLGFKVYRVARSELSIQWGVK